MNERTCNTCGNEIEEESERTCFTYDGFEFRLPKDHSVCNDCTEEYFKDLFDRLGPDLVSKKWKGCVLGRTSEIKVDWKNLSRNHDTFHDKIEILVALGILSPKEKGNWELILYRSGLNLSPYGGPCTYYFTERSYLEDYIRTLLSGSRLYCNDFLKARRIDEVASKEELLGES